MHGVRVKPDVSALASLDQNKLAVLAWHYHDDDVPGPDADVTLDLAGLHDGSVHVSRFLIDATHSNAFSAWQKLGSPAQLSAPQYAQLEAAGRLAQVGADEHFVVSGGRLTSLPLARQAVLLLLVQWDPSA